MNKSILPLIIFLLSFHNSYSQNSRPQLSASARQYLWFQSQEKKTQKINDLYVYTKDNNNKVYINTIIKVDDGFNAAKLQQNGVKIGTFAKDIWTVRVPLNYLQQFVKTPGIKYIDFDQPCFPDLDSARKFTRVDSVHQGIYLPQSYTGKGVVMGIVDAGFDYTHPTFFDTTLSHFRIKKVWEQKNNSGTAPANYGYGTEYNDSAAIWQKEFDISGATHGTHVMGIAGGSGGLSSANNNRFRGMAFESDLVAVAIYPSSDYWLNTGMVDMLDGISYVFNYANTVQKPAVANLSWGCPLGPRDGSSLFSQACNNLVAPGRIFVLSGGNNGNNKIHLKKTFSSNDNVVKTICTFPTTLSENRNQIDVWGEAGIPFCMNFSLYNLNQKVDSTVNICLNDTTQLIHLIGTNSDTCFITITTVASEFNGKPHMLIQLYSRVADRLAISIEAQAGTINMWQGIVVETSGHYGTFTKFNYPWAVNGDTEMTCGDLVSTQHGIAVAAYNSKPAFKNISGQNLSYSGYAKGAIALFSSKGPTADGRVKPDIAGPGLALASSVSSFDSTYYPGGDDYSSVITSTPSPFNGKNYNYAMAGGTSISSPSVSGIVALLLEIDSTLNPSEIKTLLSNTAIQDSYTGVIPTGGSTTWGGGKVNAYKAIASHLGVLSVKQNNYTINSKVFPNPGNGKYMLEIFSDKQQSLNWAVYDIEGRTLINSVSTINFGLNTISIDLRNYSQGIYFLNIFSDNSQNTIKLIKQ
ncbi:MAG: S8 family peptidase [Bacteroidia bacterium]|nr:S8 family peptidase [Bacteroidia bacterium]MCZ2248841.1 S8 family peptidase [Bacteroidia bacterium]